MTSPDGTFDYTRGQAEPWRTPTIADLNGDGHDDVLFYDKVGGLFEPCISTGSGADGFDCTSGGWLPRFSVYAANFDNDGRTDLFLHNADTGLWFKVLTRAEGWEYVSGGWAQWAIDVIDLDGDRKTDVFLFNPATRVFYQA
jgi:hypothetical protein